MFRERVQALDQLDECLICCATRCSVEGVICFDEGPDMLLLWIFSFALICRAVEDDGVDM